MKVIQVLDGGNACLVRMKGSEKPVYVTGTGGLNLVDGDKLPQNNYFDVWTSGQLWSYTWEYGYGLEASPEFKRVILKENGTHSYTGADHAVHTVKSYIYERFKEAKVEDGTVLYLGEELNMEEAGFVWRNFSKYVFIKGRRKLDCPMYTFDFLNAKNRLNAGERHINWVQFRYYLNNGGRLYFIATQNGQRVTKVLTVQGIRNGLAHEKAKAAEKQRRREQWEKEDAERDSAKSQSQAQEKSQDAEEK